MKIISIFLISLFLLSCEDETTNKADQNSSKEKADNSEYLETEEPPPPKQLEWANGNIYSYDFTETIIKTFQKKNKQSDVMGVVRTLYPNVEISISKKKAKKNEVQN